MKNRMATMTGPSFGLSFETEGGAGASGGGGTAVATPPAGAGAGGAGAGAGAGAGGGDGGSRFFRNIPERDLTQKGAPAAKTEAAAGEGQATGGEAPKRYVVKDDAGQPIAGADFATQAEAEAYIAANTKTADGEGAAAGGEKTAAELAAEALAEVTGAAKAAPGEAGAVDVAPDAVLKTPILGRFKTIKEAEDYFRQSGAHTQKVDADLKKERADNAKALATRDAELAAARAELETVRKTPHFNELTKEQFEKLAKEDPAAAIDYRIAERDHKQGIQNAKDEAAHTAAQKKQKAEAVNAEIERSVVEMSADPKTYPMFKEVQPLMDRVHGLLGGDNSPLRGNPQAVNILYRLALGELQLQILKKGKVAAATATEEAKKTAAAAAAATGGTGAGAGAPPRAKTAQQLKDEAWKNAIDAAAPKRVLSFVQE